MSSRLPHNGVPLMCVLRVTGKQFDPDAFLAVSGFSADRVFHAGERSSRPSGKVRDVSGFTIFVRSASWASLYGQVSDAIQFLRDNETALATLRPTPGVDDMLLDFPVDLRIDRKTVMAQCDYFPPELVSRAGALGLGIERSVYPRDFEQLAKASATKRRKRGASHQDPARSRRYTLMKLFFAGRPTPNVTFHCIGRSAATRSHTVTNIRVE